jgi:hypothetical protein
MSTLISYPEYLLFRYQGKVITDRVIDNKIYFKVLVKINDITEEVVEYHSILNLDIKNINSVVLEYFPDVYILKDNSYHCIIPCSDKPEDVIKTIQDFEANMNPNFITEVNYEINPVHVPEINPVPVLEIEVETNMNPNPTTKINYEINPVLPFKIEMGANMNPNPTTEVNYEINPVSVPEIEVETDMSRISFRIYENGMTIEHIAKCKGKSGTYYLTRLISLAKELYLKNISLSDGSILIFGEEEHCSFLLFIYYILLHGYSWYNKYGFKSSSHEKDMKHNAIIRQMNILDFIKEGFYAENKFLPDELKNNELTIDKYISEMKETLSDIFDEKEFERMTVVQFIKKIDQDYISKMKECDDKMKFISKVILRGGYFISYDNFLELKI